ncbi:hypothetical protein DXG01_003714 [Tephrocybe rancida]|nr:hypothetical protein DXG01_003714 [Tephrocybe rancida]
MKHHLLALFSDAPVPLGANNDSKSTSRAPPQVSTASTSDAGGPGVSAFEPPDVDRHSPAEIANTYHRFETLSLATHNLRTKMSSFLSGFYVNAVQFPPLLEGDPKHPVYLNSDELRGLSSLPVQFRENATALGLFRQRLDEFKEYSDEVEQLNASIEDFEKELEYRAACLRAYEGQLDQRPIRQYIHDLAEEMGAGLDNMIFSFQHFNKIGMPLIQSEQKQDTQNVLEISGVATFFSAVTATMLQISFTFHQSTTMDIVNTMWFCSLVLSIGAALNNLLATAWKRSIFGLPARMLENWVSVWLRSSPSVLLASSIWFFTVGLVLFIFASSQPGYTSTLTLITIAVASLGLMSVLASMAHKVWIGPFFAAIQSSRIEKSGSEPPKFVFRGPTFPHPVGDSTSDLSDTFSLFPKSSNVLHASFTSLQRRFSLSRLGPGSTGLENDLEKPSELPQVSRPSEAQAAWKRGAKAATAMSAFRQGVSRQSTYKLDAITELDTPPSSGHFQPHKSPFLLKFCDTPRRVIPLRYGTVQDLEYSPNGQFLATTHSFGFRGIVSSIAKITDIFIRSAPSACPSKAWKKGYLITDILSVERNIIYKLDMSAYILLTVNLLTFYQDDRPVPPR